MGLKEGSPYSNILKLMKNQGYNKDTNFMVGQVTSISPLTINCGQYNLSDGDFYIAEQLTTYTRNIEIEATQINAVNNTTNSQPAKTSDGATLNPFQITTGTITFQSPLAVNDFVVVVLDGKDFFVIDKVVLN